MSQPNRLADHSRPLNQDPVRLRRKRVEAGLTGAGLAAAAGCSAPYVSQLQKGRYSASPQMLVKLADALGCEVEDLMPSAA